MSLFKPKTKEETLRLCMLSAVQLFNIVSLIVFLVKYMQGSAPVTAIIYGVLSIVYCAIPDIAQKICKFKIATPMYALILAYAVAPLLGHSYGLYYSMWWWDKLLHVMGGVIFALFGAYLPKLFLKDEHCNTWLCVLCGFIFSVAIAGLWECVEFTVDTLFHTDMQKDTIVYRIDSYLLHEQLYHEKGQLLTVGEVNGMLINGDVAMQGYLDLGKTDSMLDMLVETLGAALFSVAYILDKGKHTAFHYLPQTAPQRAETAEENEWEAEVATAQNQTVAEEESQKAEKI